MQVCTYILALRDWLGDMRDLQLCRYRLRRGNKDY